MRQRHIQIIFVAQVESVLKTNPLVDNLCVYAASDKTHTVAILVPAKEQLVKFAGKMDPSFRTKEMTELCENKDVIEVHMRRFSKICRR